MGIFCSWVPTTHPLLRQIVPSFLPSGSRTTSLGTGRDRQTAYGLGSKVSKAAKTRDFELESQRVINEIGRDKYWGRSAGNIDDDHSEAGVLEDTRSANNLENQTRVDILLKANDIAMPETRENSISEFEHI